MRIKNQKLIGKKLFLLVLLLSFIFILSLHISFVSAAEYVTKEGNFLIEADKYAQAYGDKSEKDRQELSKLWGFKYKFNGIDWPEDEMPKWFFDIKNPHYAKLIQTKDRRFAKAPAILDIKINKYVDTGGGQTEFVFFNGEAFGWKMDIEGESDKALKEAVIPHEVNHMVFASNFRVPLKRWIDEGAATSVESIDVQIKTYKQYLAGKTPYSFDKLFSVNQYYEVRGDVRLFYAESNSVVNYLLKLKGRKVFTSFIRDYIKNGAESALAKNYGFSVSALQAEWIKWAEKGYSGYPYKQHEDSQVNPAAGTTPAEPVLPPRPPRANLKPAPVY